MLRGERINEDAILDYCRQVRTVTRAWRRAPFGRLNEQGHPLSVHVSVELERRLWGVVSLEEAYSVVRGVTVLLEDASPDCQKVLRDLADAGVLHSVVPPVREPLSSEVV